MQSPIPLGNRLEPLLDNLLVDQLDAAMWRIHAPQPRELAVVCDEPWEGCGPGYSTVLQHAGQYHLYYRGMPVGGSADHDERQITCYAQSDDGITWHKPALGLIECDGSKANNMVWRGVESHNFTPFVDPRPRCPEDEKFKAVGGVKWGGKGLRLLGSGDGVHWRLLGNEPLKIKGNFDSQNIVFFDHLTGLFRAYWRDGRKGDPHVPDGRDVRTACSPDLLTWTEPTWLAYDPNRSGSPHRDQSDDPSGDHHQFYAGAVLPYPRAPHVLVGFPMRYVDRGWTASTNALPDPVHRRAQADKGIAGGRPTRLGTVVTDTLFMAGRDGVCFKVWPSALVRPGMQRTGSWYYSGAWPSWGLVQTPSTIAAMPDEFSLYIQERAAPQGPGALRRHAIRLDGFTSLYAPLTGGQVITKPLTFTGSQLNLNFSTSAGGLLRVEIQSPDATALPGWSLDECDPQYGDELARRVTWQGRHDLTSLAGKSVRLRIELKDADLYALQFPRPTN